MLSLLLGMVITPIAYAIGVFTKKHKAIKAAESHTTYRGGKYACVVDEYVNNVYSDDADVYGKEVFSTKSNFDN